MRFIVITPVKNEEKYFQFIADSMLSQSIKPIKWIVVDDGSTDNSAKLIKSYSMQHNWIIYIKHDDNGELRSYGAKVIRAFNYGVKEIGIDQYDFIIKLDADLTIPYDYFSLIAEAFENNPKLGICGGIIVENETDFDGKLKKDQYVQGAVKSIRKKCFDEIGGLWETNGWDGIDQHLARYKGWEVKNLLVPIIHHRKEAEEYKSLNFYFQNGSSSYILGNNFFLTFVRVIVRIKEKPYLFAALYFLFGFIYAKLTKKRIVDNDFAKYIRKYNYERIRKEL